MDYESKLSKISRESFRQIVQEQPPLPIFYFPGSQPSPVCRKTMKILEKKKNPIKNYADLAPFISDQVHSKILPCTFIVSLENKGDLITTTKLLEELKKRDWQWQSEIIILSGINHPEITAHFIRQKCTFILKLFSTPRSLAERIEEQLAMQTLLQLSINHKSIMELSYQSKPTLPFTLGWNKALSLKEDLWFIPAENFVHRTENQWSVALIGPHPNSGKWTASKTIQDLWKWVPSFGRTSILSREPGEWVFHGKKPHAIQNFWRFNGQAPKLEFINRRQKNFMKFWTLPAGTLEITPNNPHLTPELFQIIKSQELLKPTHKASTPQPEENNTDSPSTDFRMIDDPMVFREFIKQALEKKTTFILWQNNSKFRIKAQLSQLTPDGSKMILKISEESQILLAGQDEPDAKKNYSGNFNTDQGCAFFSTRNYIMDFKKKVLTLYPDQAFFYVQRRENPRVKPNPKYSIKILSPEIKGEIVNYSSDGICLQFTPSQYESLTKNRKPELVLGVLDHQIRCELNLKWKKIPTKPTEPTQDLANPELIIAGFQYAGISEIDRQTLRLFIFQQSVDNELD
jgi:hypothetical protein